MRQLLLAICGVLLLLSSSLVYSVEAQSVLPDIEIECEPEVRIHVYKGSTLSGYVLCILTNPTSYEEEVEIAVESGTLSSTFPESITVPPAAEVDFQVSLRAEVGMMVQIIPIEIEAVVTKINSIDASSLPESSDSASVDAQIMEYSNPTIELVESEITVTAGSDFEISVIYGNRGNGLFDTLFIGVSEYSRDSLDDSGFTISSPMKYVEIASGETKVVVFESRAPKEVNGEEYFVVDFYAESEFSCRYEISGCNRVSMMTTVLVLEDTAEESVISSLGGGTTVVVFGGIGGGLLVVAAVIVILKRKNKPDTVGHELDDDFDEEFEDDDFEDDFDEEFEDDLEDDFFEDL